jgi:hypothetical protein
MINIKQAFLINEKIILIGDNVKLTLNTGKIRYGVLTNIDTRYKTVTITIEDNTFHIGYHPLNVNFEFIKNIEKFEEGESSNFPVRKTVKVKGKIVNISRADGKINEFHKQMKLKDLECVLSAEKVNLYHNGIRSIFVRTDDGEYYEEDTEINMFEEYGEYEVAQLYDGNYDYICIDLK